MQLIQLSIYCEIHLFVYLDTIGAFEDPDIIHVDDSIDPVRDLEVISAELRLKVYMCTNMLLLLA